MTEPVKIKFDYQSPENVEAEVPGAQKIREATTENLSNIENSQNGGENSRNNGENPQNGGENSQKSDNNSKVSNENLAVATTDDFSLEPVIVVTKKEATFTKGDLKLQKVTVTEDISVNYQHLFKKQTMPGKTVDDLDNGESIITTSTLVRSADDEVVMTRHRHVISEKRNGIQGEPVLIADILDDKKNKTKIPVSKFRQTVERVKSDRRATKERESHIPVRRSSIPKPVKDNKQSLTTVAKEITNSKKEIKKDLSKPTTTKTVITKETSKPITETVITKEPSKPFNTQTVITKEVSEPTTSKTVITKESSEPTTTKTVITKEASETISSKTFITKQASEHTTFKTVVTKEVSEPTTSKTVITNVVSEPTTSETVITKEPSKPFNTQTVITQEASVTTISKGVITEDTSESTTNQTVTTKDAYEPSTNEKIITKETTEPEDEFDKIYAEIVTTPTEVVFVDNLLDTKVEDPEKLESKFEEIIHDYDEHKVEPIDVEVVKRSRIPFLQRISQQDVELNAQSERTSKIIAARDKLRLRRNSLNKSKSFEDELDKELRKSHESFTVNSVITSEAEKKVASVTALEKEIKEEKISPNHFNSTTDVTKQFIETSSSQTSEHIASSSVVQTSFVNEKTTIDNNDRNKNLHQLIIEVNEHNKGDVKAQDTLNTKETKEKLCPETVTEKETKEEKILSKTPNSKTEVTKQFTKSITTSSSQKNEDLGSSIIVKTTTVKEVTTNENIDNKENQQHFIKEDNIVKGSINIGIPVFNSYTHEHSENSESTKTVEVKRVLSYTTNNEDISVTNIASNVTKESRDTTSESIQINRQFSQDIKSEIKVSQSIEFQSLISNNDDNKVDVKYFEDHTTEEENLLDKIKPNTEDIKNKTNVEDIVQLRGKVGKLKNKIESKELIEIEANKRESINELTKKKAVLSKIAMFERKETEEPIKARAPKREIKPPNLIVKDLMKTENVHIHTPLIVEEIFKPFQADIDLNNKVNKEESPVKTDNESTKIVKAERVTVESPESVHYAVETLVQERNIEEKFPDQTNIDSKYAVQKVEISSIEDIQPSKTMDLPLSKIPSQELSKPEDKEVVSKQMISTKLNITKELQPPVFISGFKPVSELLRSFESKKEGHKSLPKRTVSKVEHNLTTTKVEPLKRASIAIENPVNRTEVTKVRGSISSAAEISYSEPYNNENYDDFETKDFKSLDEVFSKETDYYSLKRQEEDMKRAKSLAELNLGDAVKGKVTNILSRMTSLNRIEIDRKDVINKKEMPRKRSVSEKIALFEGKVTPSCGESCSPLRIFKSEKTLTVTPRTEKKIERTRTEYTHKHTREVLREKSVVDKTEKIVEAVKSDKNDEEWVQKKIEELSNAKLKYGTMENMTNIELSNGMKMPVLAVGTALLDPRLTYNVITAAIDLGYRAIDSAYIYGNERQIGEAIKAKIDDGTVKREDLFIINKLWSTFHRTDLVEGACRSSLETMGLDYFDLYLIHNPMSFKEGGSPIPKIATVIQYSEHDYLDAWFGMEQLVNKGLVRGIGVSNFNSVQLQRVLDKGRIKPVVNQVECHPYMSQERLDLFCSERNVTLSCFGSLGSKGTPTELTSGQPPVIDDALVQVMASGLGITSGQLLISYQLENGHGVVIKSTSADHLWGNLQALNIHLTTAQVDALHALNRNKRIFTFKGMGDTHKNYPFNIAF